MIRFNGYDIELTSGDTLFFKVDLTGRSLPEGSVAYFTVKDNPKSDDSLIRKKIDIVDGTVDIRLSSEDTYLPARTYYWDVRVLIPVDSGGYEVETPMEYAAFTIIDAIGFPGDDGQPPGLDENLPRLSLLIEEANKLIEELKDYKVPDEQIEQIVRDYLEENPPEAGVNQDEVKRVVDEAIDELPAWSKEPAPPKYTAADVGALPATTKIPDTISDLTNDSGFITNAVSDLTNYYLKSETYTRDEINQRISAIPKFAISVVTALPTSGISETTIYLVKSGSDADLYTEYIRANGAWEILGSQRVDLTGYATETWVAGQLTGYQPAGDYLMASELQPAVDDALAQAKESGEFDGQDGAAGVGIEGIMVNKTPDENGNTNISIRLTDGQVENFSLKNGKDGESFTYEDFTPEQLATLKGEPGYTPVKGKDYSDGLPGTSVTVQSVNESQESGGTNVVTFSDGKKLNVKNGKDGSDATVTSASIASALDYTPADAAEVDQLSEAIEEIGTQDEIVERVNASSESFIVTELAKRGQLEPEFANSIEECIDTSKMYVLPDGYIYAYMSKTGPMFTNLIPSAIDSDGTPYNGGLGYKVGWRFGAGVYATGAAWGAGQANDAPNGVITGLIPYNPSTNKKIRACGWTTAYESNDYIVFYDASFKAIEQRGRLQYYVESYGQTYADEAAFDNAAKTFTFDIDVMISKSGWYGGLIRDNAKYVAFSIQNANLEALTVTFDEEIAFGTTSAWTNTGHAFVPADYEDRIIDLEQASESHETRIKALEMYGAESVTSEEIPAYIKTAANEVISKVIEQQGNRSFTMVGISDFHYGGTGDNKDNLIRACKAIAYISGRINVDAIATLGDNLPYGASYDDSIRANADRWSKEINEILAVTQKPGIVDFRTPGNHDRFGTTELYMPDNAIYSFITGYNRQCEIGNVPGGWAYKDFSGHKLRVIVLNTAETEGKGRFSTHSGYHMSTAQYNWLIDTLDISSKPDASDWQILILSHHRADDWQVAAKNETTYILPNILHAYNTGSSYTGVNAEDDTTIACNFAGKNAAKLIGQIHGHHHAYIYSPLGLSNGGTQTNVMAISTPTSCFGTGEGHNDDNAGNWYDSVKDTAEETAFCVYCIDLDNHVIQAIHYGNGIDRVIAY